MQIFAKDLGFPEAPVILPDGSFLFVEMSPDTGCITHISADGSSRRVVARTGRPNGLARDRNGLIWVAETAMRALVTLSLDGEHQVFVDGCEGEAFLFLNDLAFAPNGDVYLTDSGITFDELAPGGELAPNYRDLRYDGRVYRIDVKTAAIQVIDRGLLFTNGIAFGPDGDLYVAETLSGNIYRYASRGGLVTGERKLFANVIEHFNPAELKGPDGMKFAANGNLYVCVYGQGDVTVVDPRGVVVERIKVEGQYPTNLVFTQDGRRQIFVTEAVSGTVQIFDVGTDGLPLHG